MHRGMNAGAPFSLCNLWMLSTRPFKSTTTIQSIYLPASPDQIRTQIIECAETIVNIVHYFFD